MRHQNRFPRHWFVGALSLALAVSTSAAEPTKTPKPAPTIPEVELRGQVVCLAEEMHRLHEADLPTGHAHVYGFKTKDGKFYTLLRTKLSEALFDDERLRTKELLLKGRVFPKSQVFEPTLIRSVRNGVVHDLYYYCDVCDIQSVSPAECACCQGPVELIEKPR